MNRIKDLWKDNTFHTAFHCYASGCLASLAYNMMFENTVLGCALVIGWIAHGFTIRYFLTDGRRWQQERIIGYRKCLEGKDTYRMPFLERTLPEYIKREIRESMT